GDRALDAARVPLDLLWREPLGWNLSSAAERVEFDEVSHPPSAGDPDRQLVHSSRRNSRVEAHYRGCGRIHAFAITPSASLGSFTACLNLARIARLSRGPGRGQVSSSIRCRHQSRTCAYARVLKEGQTIVPDSDRSRRHSDPTPHM